MRPLVLLALVGCTPAEPDEVAPVPVLETLPVAHELAARAMDIWAPESVYLGWIETVWGHGLLRLHEVSGEPVYADYVDTWLRSDLADFTSDPPRAFDSSDSMAPASVASLRMAADPSLDLSPILDAADAYLLVANRTDEGAITHWKTETPFVQADQVWVDSMFMFGTYLLAEHARTGDREALDLFVEQYALFSELCRDPADALYRHAYDDSTDANIPVEPVYWNRGNAWVLIAAAELLAGLPPGDPAYEAIAPRFEQHAAAVLAHQADDGLWRTVLNVEGDDANYTETSGSALLAYGLLRGTESVLDRDEVLPAVVAATRGVLDRLDERAGELVVTGTSYGTNPGDYDYYVAVPTGDDLMLGFGAVVLLLAEADGLPTEPGAGEGALAE